MGAGRVRVRRVRGSLRVIFLFSLAACGGSGSGDDGTSPNPDVPPSTPAACGSGFEEMGGGDGCVPVLPDAACPEGTRAQIGNASCVPVGVTACASGFVKHASGWGCDVVVSKTACTGGTRERFGSESCEPVTDCNAPFPPSDATHFVNAAYTDGQIDATHFRLIKDAIAVAPSGAVIAVEAGTYEADKIVPKVPVTVIGRCAEQTVLHSPDAATSGIFIQNVEGVVVKNLRAGGYAGGAVLNNGHASLEGVVLDGNFGAGVAAVGTNTVWTITNVVTRGTKVAVGSGQAFGIAAQKAASIVATDVVSSGNEFANVGSGGAGVSMKISRSIVRSAGPPTTGPYVGAYGVGVYHTDGATLTVEQSLVFDNSGSGITVGAGGPTGQPSTGTVVGSVVHGTKMDPVRQMGRGIETSGGSTLVVEQTTSYGNAEFDLLVTEGSKGDIHDSTTFGTEDRSVFAGVGLLVSDKAHATVRSLAMVSAAAVGLQVQDNGALDMSDSLVFRAHGIGVSARKDSPITAKSSTIDGAEAVGLLTSGANISFDGVLVTRTVPSQHGDTGRGASVQDGGKLDLAASAITDNFETGIVVIDGNASLTMRGSTVGPTKLNLTGSFGSGIILSGGVKATIEASTITSSAAVGFLSSGSGASIKSSFVSKNAIGIHAQDGSSLVETETPDDPLSVFVSPDTQFVDNQARIGSGQIPLPGTVVAPK
jgi:hypothetical protein